MLRLFFILICLAVLSSAATLTVTDKGPYYGDTFTATCTTDASGVDRYIFFVDGVAIYSGYKSYKTFEPITLDNAGEYSCKARDGNGDWSDISDGVEVEVKEKTYDCTTGRAGPSGKSYLTFDTSDVGLSGDMTKQICRDACREDYEKCAAYDYNSNNCRHYQRIDSGRDSDDGRTWCKEETWINIDTKNGVDIDTRTYKCYVGKGDSGYLESHDEPTRAGCAQKCVDYSGTCIGFDWTQESASDSCRLYSRKRPDHLTENSGRRWCWREDPPDAAIHCWDNGQGPLDTSYSYTMSNSKSDCRNDCEANWKCWFFDYNTDESNATPCRFYSGYVDPDLLRSSSGRTYCWIKNYYRDWDINDSAVNAEESVAVGNSVGEVVSQSHPKDISIEEIMLGMILFAGIYWTFSTLKSWKILDCNFGRKHELSSEFELLSDTSDDLIQQRI